MLASIVRGTPLLALLFAALLAPSEVHGLQDGSPAGPRPSDWESPDAIISALYDLISVAPGEKVDWARDSALFLPGARKVAVTRQPDGTPTVHNMTSEQFITMADAELAGGFTEYEIGRVTERFGNIMQAFSSYEGRQTPDGPVITRGINSIQLVYDETRWWIVSISWDSETSANPLPAKYLRQ